MLAGRDVTLETRKVENNGSQNATGARINTGGDLGIKAENDVTVIGSSAKAGGALDVTAENGSVSIATADVTRKTDDGYSKATTTTQQASQLSSGTNRYGVYGNFAPEHTKPHHDLPDATVFGILPIQDQGVTGVRSGA
ncbi:hypothetical protein [Phyllobacterium phragmitis]|uniref:hypothetical protein n=1 Tax=Phyllobacterium phragmitis TaxID=2670329 RepID=UPI001FE1EFEC|nr:hypothetical protein [Phyllobacterium phragmitis]